MLKGWVRWISAVRLTAILSPQGHGKQVKDSETTPLFQSLDPQTTLETLADTLLREMEVYLEGPGILFVASSLISVALSLFVPRPPRTTEQKSQSAVLVLHLLAPGSQQHLLGKPNRTRGYVGVDQYSVRPANDHGTRFPFRGSLLIFLVALPNGHPSSRT